MPASRQCRAHARPIGRALAGRAQAADFGEQAANDLFFLLKQRLANGFSRVGREHRFNVERGQGGQYLIGTESQRLRTRQRFMQTTGLITARLDLVAASATNAMDPFGDIDDLKIRRECASQAFSVGWRLASHGVEQQRYRMSRLAAPDRVNPKPLHLAVEVFAQLLGQHVTDEGTQAADVVLQGGVDGGEFDIAEAVWIHHRSTQGFRS